MPVRIHANSESLPGLILLDHQETTLYIVFAHHQNVSRALACQVRQIHSVFEFLGRFAVHSSPHHIVGIIVARFLAVLSHALARILFGGDAPLSGHVEHVGQSGDLAVGPNLGSPGVPVMSPHHTWLDAGTSNSRFNMFGISNRSTVAPL